MAVSSVHIELDKFFHETRGLNKDNCWEWFESFRNTLLYKGYEENPHPYAMYLLDEMECYSAYCAVGNIEGRVVAELERKKEEVTYEAVYNICVEKKGEEYLNLKEKESRYIEAHPEANKWKSNGRRSAKSSSTKPKEGSKKDAENPVERPTKSDSKGPGDLVYGSCENVFLTQDEFNKIAMDVGNLKEANSLVEDLSLNLADGKIESSNHFATLQKWAKWRKNHPNDERLETFHERDDRNQIETMRRVFSM